MGVMLKVFVKFPFWTWNFIYYGSGACQISLFFTKELYIFDGKSKTGVIIVLPGEQIAA